MKWNEQDRANNGLLDSNIAGLCSFQKGSYSVLFLLLSLLLFLYLNDFLNIGENFIPISLHNWQAVANIHLENYC